MKFSPVYWLTCVLMVVAASLSATTIVMPSDEQLVAKSPLIVRGTVISTGVVDRNGALWTETVLEVEQTLKGKADSQIVIREMGGETEDRITKIFGAPEYRNGERVLAFVTPTPRGDYQTVDLFVGKFSEEKTLNGQRLWARNDQTDKVHMLDANFREIEAKNIQRDAAGFEHYIGARIAGKNAPANYGVENPVIDTPALRGGASRDRLAPDFTLISEPTIYRWFLFERGSTAQWFSYGQQNGYAGGGINEVRTAMNSWNSYTSARISYQYVGAASGTPTTLNSPNSVNDIVFNDARNEISGSWNPSSGGVVGQGGFNGVRNGGNWTSTFTADATHTQRTYSTFDIVEGHMTIQDNVSPSTGISSSELAEIIAHEFGHTLGLGHSSDNTALMYFQVTGLGPTLRADDQLAARWLYPNGSSPNPNPTPTPTTVPAAPSNLAASVSGTSVALTWNDNASNETTQSIYVAAGSGGFSKVGDVASNVRSATLNGFSTGSYRIYISASNSAGESAPSNVVSVNVGVGVNANFSVSQSSGTAGITNFAFTDQSTGPITSRTWEFGDGTSTTVTNPTHVYSQPGTYTVALTVSGSGTQSVATRQITVTIPSVPLVAGFTYSPSNPTTNADVRFTDTSTGGVTQWVWNFGDGTSSGEQNPVKRYSNAGTYSVLLTVYRNSTTAVTSQSITVGAAAPVTPAVSAEFDFSPPSPDFGATVSFTDRSAGSPTNWLWSFGDGSTSTLKNPTHAYGAPGTYFVTLTASNASSSGNATHSVTVAAVTFTYRSLIPVSTQTTGLNGANWRTELSIFNAGDDGVSVTLTFIPGAGGASLTRSIFISPRQSAVYANALLDLFGLNSAAGAIQIVAPGTFAAPALKITSRTFTNGTRGTYGQAVPDLDFGAFDQMLYLTGMESDSQYRTNVGLVNKTDQAVAATLTLFSADGSVLGTNTVNVPANNFQQNGLASLFPVVSGVQHQILSMQISAAAPDAISVYASVVNNETNDPVYIQAIPAVKSNRLVIPVIGRLPGINGTFFRSDVAYYNPTSTTMTLSMRYLVSGADNRNVSARTMTLAPGRSLLQADVLGTMGLTSGAGAFEITWNTSNGPIVTSRTYTTTETGGTFGQSIDPIQAFATRIDVTGLRSDSAFRSNVGFVNGGDATIGVNVTLLSSTGQSLRTASIQLAPQSQAQYTLGALFPGLDTATIGSFTLRADSSAPTMFAYGSIVDNGSGDPVFFAGR